MRVENSKGECNFGQHEINFHYGPVLQTADDHTIYKNGAKEIAAQEGMSITYMAKFNELEGNSCHIHLSLAGQDGSPLFADEPETFDRFVAGQLACMRDLTLLFAPHVNSYKRFAEGSFAPTAVAWGNDNRTCSMRVVGHGAAKRVRVAPARRRRQPLPGAERDDRRRPARDRREARARARRSRATPTNPTSRACRGTLRDARDLFAASEVARAAFGEDVVDHYLNNARVELAAFESAVTDWERFRGFERL